MMNLKIYFAIVFIATLFSHDLFAMDASGVTEKIKPAVVKVEVYFQKVPVSFGTGFFVSADGYLITNQHVVSDAFGMGYSLKIKTSTGEISEIRKIARCSINSEPDLCLLKADITPKAWIDVTRVGKVKEGQEVVVLGHPRGLEFTVSNGIISSIRDRVGVFPSVDFRPARLQLTAPMSPGNSGGPVVDMNGNLVGVATSGIFDTRAQNLNFAVSASEVSVFYADKKQHKLEDFNQFKKDLFTELKKSSSEAFDRQIAPIFKGQRSALTFPSTLKNAQAQSFTYLMPKFPPALECHENATLKACIFNSGDIFSVQTHTGFTSILSLDGTKVKPKPLDFLGFISETPEWSKLIKSLTEGQRKYLYSQPDPLKCKKIHRELLSKGSAEVSVNYCSGFVYNSKKPNASLLTIFLQKDGSKNIVEISTICTNPANCKIIFGLLDVVANSFEPLP